MSSYVRTRLTLTIPVLLGVSIAVFAMLRLLPGDPAQIMLAESGASAERVAALRRELGLDDPLVLQSRCPADRRIIRHRGGRHRDHQEYGLRVGAGGADRRDDRPRSAGAGDDASHGAVELVGANAGAADCKRGRLGLSHVAAVPLGEARRTRRMVPETNAGSGVICAGCTPSSYSAWSILPWLGGWDGPSGSMPMETTVTSRTRKRWKSTATAAGRGEQWLRERRGICSSAMSMAMGLRCPSRS